MVKDEYGNRRFYGVYRALVEANNDPLAKARLKLRIPQVLFDAVTEWAWPVTIPGVTTHIPTIGSGIWAMFEGGDPSFPIWLGTFDPQTSV